MTLNDKNKILDMLVGDVKIYTLCSSSEPNYEYSYMQLANSSKTAYNIEYMSVDELIKEAWKLKTPRWIRLTDICTNIIGETVWLNKIHQFTVDAITIGKDGTTVYMTDSSAHTNENLWIKG